MTQNIFNALRNHFSEAIEGKREKKKMLKDIDEMQEETNKSLTTLIGVSVCLMGGSGYQVDSALLYEDKYHKYRISVTPIVDEIEQPKDDAETLTKDNSTTIES